MRMMKEEIISVKGDLAELILPSQVVTMSDALHYTSMNHAIRTRNAAQA